MRYEFRDELLELYETMPAEHRRQWDRMTSHLVEDWHRESPRFEPDIVIAPEGQDKPYIYRWYVVPLDRSVNEPEIMFHIQVASDPERPLHDHPWDNTSQILAGGYDEIYARPWCNGISVKLTHPLHRSLRAGDRVHRDATEAHRLILPPDIPYTMSLFTSGPKVREWGFWYPDGWHDNKRHVAERDGVSVHVKREEE